MQITLSISFVLSKFEGIEKALQAMSAALGPPNKIKISFEGAPPMTEGRETDLQTIQASAIETDAQENPVTIDPANAVWGIEDSTIATPIPNADGSCAYKALKVGVTNVTLTDKATGAVGTEVLTVTAHPTIPNKLAIKFGEAV